MRRLLAGLFTAMIMAGCAGGGQKVSDSTKRELAARLEHQRAQTATPVPDNSPPGDYPWTPGRDDSDSAR